MIGEPRRYHGVLRLERERYGLSGGRSNREPHAIGLLGDRRDRRLRQPVGTGFDRLRDERRVERLARERGACEREPRRMPT